MKIKLNSIVAIFPSSIFLLLWCILFSSIVSFVKHLNRHAIIILFSIFNRYGYMLRNHIGCFIIENSPTSNHKITTTLENSPTSNHKITTTKYIFYNCLPLNKRLKNVTLPDFKVPQFQSLFKNSRTGRRGNKNWKLNWIL